MKTEIKELYTLLGETKSDIMEINQSLGRSLDEKSDFQRGYIYGIKVAITRLERKEKENARI